MGRGPVTVNILYLVMRQYVAPPSGVLDLVSMWHNVAAPFGGTTSCGPLRGPCTISSGCG